MDRQARLAQAGQWLHEQREGRGLSARDLAEKLSVYPQSVYNWEAGKFAVDDDRAEQLAVVFGMDIIEVRRNLGLWVPEPSTAPPGGEEMSLEDIEGLIAYLRQRRTQVRLKRTIANIDRSIRLLELARDERVADEMIDFGEVRQRHA